MKEFKLPSVNNIQIGDIGFRFRKDFIGHGIFEGQVIEINNNLRRCIYSDGDIKDLNLEKLSYWNSKYLPSKKKIKHLEIPPSPPTSPSSFRPDDSLKIPPFPFLSPSYSLPDSPSPTYEDIVYKFFLSKQDNPTYSQIFINDINMMTKNVHSLRSKNQAINLDAIIDIMI